MNDQNQNELFPIRALAEQTAIGSSTLRAWERRYGLLKPHRTPKGHRLYSQSDVVRVRKIVELLEDGHSHKDIADIFRIEEDVSAIDSHKKDTGSCHVPGRTILHSQRRVSSGRHRVLWQCRETSPPDKVTLVSLNDGRCRWPEEIHGRTRAQKNVVNS